MRFFGAIVSGQVLEFLQDHLHAGISLASANEALRSASGIIDLIKSEEDLFTINNTIAVDDMLEEVDRTEYGDFQTNQALARHVCTLLKQQGTNPEVVIEPTCGVGNFILASLQAFQAIKHVHGVEVYKPYVYETQFSILDFYLSNPRDEKPQIIIHHTNVFDFDFSGLAENHANNRLLVVGNPPWVTNAQLGVLNSENLPVKANFKKHQGLDALTGKANFDIAECITLMTLNNFQNMEGHLALLVKNSVIKNIVYNQLADAYKISNIHKYRIDSKKEFGVSVEAALFSCTLNAIPDMVCTDQDFYNPGIRSSQFGWVNNKFVSSIEDYSSQVDGICPFTWRQGVKHDCSAIMELDKVNEQYVNANNEAIALEEDLVYGLLKSSDLKHSFVNDTRKFTIVTQTKIGQDTNYIETQFPATYAYLDTHREKFNGRKSSIYKGKPPFSIFGIGDYSFKPYKVAISGLYKNFHFTLVTPRNGKPIMLDDTCYFIGFEEADLAAYTYCLLNTDLAISFLKSITFTDAKRRFTKDILMRFDLLALANAIGPELIQQQLVLLNERYGLRLDINNWDVYLERLTPVPIVN